MTRRLKRKLFLGIAVAAILAGATAAVVMAAQPAGHRHRWTARHHNSASGHRKGGTLASAASYLGISMAQLREQLGSGKSLADVATATGGKSAAGLVAALEASQRQKLAATAANLQAHVTTEVDRVRGSGGARLAVARYLGLSVTQLRELSTGKTLAQIADATAGKSEAGLIEALVTARKATLAAEVKLGAITQARANELIPHLIQRATKHVNRAPHKPGSSDQALKHRRSHLSTPAP